MKRLLLLSLATVALVSSSPAAATAAPVKHDTVAVTPLASPDSVVMSIKAAPESPAFLSIDSAAVSKESRNPSPLIPIGGLSLLAFAFAGTIKTASMDKDQNPPMLAALMACNEIVKDFYYFMQNRIIAATAATYPLCATATVTSKAKTTNATVILSNGVVVAVAATDNAWTLTGSNLVTAKTRKYLLLVSAASAFTVQASDDQATATDCRFASRPADGIAILGVLQVTNASGADFIPGTTLLGAAGITATFLDGSTDLPYLSKSFTP